MKIALVCEFPFLPPQKGVELRLYQTASLLSEMGTVWPVIVSRLNTPATRINDLKERFGQASYIIPTGNPSTSMSGKIHRFIHPKMVANRGYYVPPTSEREEIVSELRACDLVWFHSLKVADSLGIYRWDRSVLDFDDLHSQKYLQAAKLEHKLADQIKARWRAALFKKWEFDALRRFHRVAVCSENDRRMLKDHSKVIVLPNIVDKKGVDADSRRPSPDHIGFIGTLEYYANQDAILWFVNQVLPLLVKQRPSLKVRIVGSIPTSFTKIDHPNVDMLGYVDHLADELGTWSASIAPVRVGGGTRFKIIESFSQRCPVVSTTLGCYGLDVTDRRELLIADSAEQFAFACHELCQSPSLGAQLSAAAFSIWQEKYTYAAIRPVIRNLVADCN